MEKATGPVGIVGGSAGDALDGHSPANIIMRGAVGIGIGVIGGATTIVTCTVVAAPTAETAAPACIVGGVAATVVVNQGVQQALPD